MSKNTIWIIVLVAVAYLLYHHFKGGGSII